MKPGGLALIGEGHWKRTPSPEYLGLLGGTEDEYVKHQENIALGISLGLEPLFACDTSQADWDRYEWTYFSNIERWAREHPDDPQREQILQRGKLGRYRYMHGGRDALGFGLYLFRV